MPSKVVTLRMTDEELTTVDRAAERRGMSRAEFLRFRIFGPEAAAAPRPTPGPRPRPSEVAPNFKDRDR